MGKVLADGTGQVERDFGSLKTVLDVQSWPMIEDGDTASWLVEIFADGPKQVRGGSCHASGVQRPFTRECAELWVAIYGRGLKKPGPKPKDKAPTRQGTMKRVAYDCKLARDALASRVGAARSDITLAGDSRKTLQIVRAAPVVADAQPKAKAKSKANALSAKAQSKAMALKERLQRGPLRSLNWSGWQIAMTSAPACSACGASTRRAALRVSTLLGPVDVGCCVVTRHGPRPSPSIFG